MTWTPPEPKKYFGVEDEPEYYTLAQLEAVRREAIEQCAKVCESTSFSMSIEEWKAITKKEMSVKAMLACAADIRKLLERT